MKFCATKEEIPPIPLCTSHSVQVFPEQFVAYPKKFRGGKGRMMEEERNASQFQMSNGKERRIWNNGEKIITSNEITRRDSRV